jgi:hypothetical protein
MNPGPAPITSNINWTANNTESSWIGLGLGGEIGTYEVSTAFDLTGFDATTASVNLELQTDDGILDVLLNAASLGITMGDNSYAFVSFPISDGFVPGMNTFIFVWRNLSGPTGLRVRVSGTAVPI